jgi:ribulose-5-phosphate 4-epimerase/fuculose-1-phosphate aldolase
MRPTLLVVVAGACMFGSLGCGQTYAQQPTPTFEPSLDAIIEELVVANHIFADQGVVDGSGHISARHPTRRDHFLMSRSVAPALIQRDDILEFDRDGEPVDARGRQVFLERFIHSAIYRVRPDVLSVVHTHSPAVIPFSVSQVPMRATFHLAAFLSSGVPVFEIREAGGMTDLLVRNDQLGSSLATALGEHAVALMRGHGDVVVGPTIPMAVFRAVYTEVNARIQAQALTLGGAVTYLEPEEGRQASRAVDQIHLRAWDLWKRKASNPHP